VRLAWAYLAKAELHELRRYSVERWGAAVAQRYLADVRDAARLLAATPERGRLLRGPYRILRVRSHYLIAHVDAGAERVTIARVLHVAMEIERHLPR
jgi:plasmid stabilization system protein ParE